MKRTIIPILVLLSILVFLDLTLQVGSAAPRNSYEISWYIIDGNGGQEINGGVFTISGTIGQSDTAPSSGTYTINGGFWNSNVASLYRYFLSVILKNP